MHVKNDGYYSKRVFVKEIEAWSINRFGHNANKPEVIDTQRPMHPLLTALSRKLLHRECPFEPGK